MNVLLIEDNELNRDMLTRRLERKEFIVSCAEDGQSGIDMAKNEMPDIILLDLSLPVIDGWNVARQLKADANTKDIPIIALTAHAMKGDRKKALDAGCDDYDTKPVNLEGLLAKMHKLTA
jgi:CheY-like chemotaxis protein